LAPWGALGGGAFKTEEQRKSQEGRKVQATEQQLKISGVLEKIANRKNTAITSVALVSREQPYPVFSHTTETLRAGYRV